MSPKRYFLAAVFSFFPFWHSALFAGSTDLNLTPHVDLDILASQKSQDELAQEADGILEDLAALRGVSLKGMVKVAFVDKEFFGRYYLHHLQIQYPSPLKEQYEVAYQALGLLGKGDDLFVSYLKVFLSVVQGLYDPETKTLFLLQGGHSGDQERVMAHELVHALQDQQFDLKAYLEGERGLTLDEQYARTSLIEGEAEALSLDWRLREDGKDITRIGDIAPWIEQGNALEKAGLKAFGKRAVSTDAINFPYVYGVTFFQHWVRLKGWKSVEEMYRNPPRTTQQIMNSDSYFPHPLPYIRVQLSDISGNPLQDYRLIWQNSLGEYGWEAVLKNYIDEDEAAKAVTGWEGDGVQVYEDAQNSAHLLASFLVFRDDRSSEAFFKVAKLCMEKKLSIQNWIRFDDSIHWAALTDGKEAYLERFGKRVVWLEETPAGLTPRIRTSLWDFKRLSSEVGPPKGTIPGSP